jgi:hypothetical protein
MWWSCHLLYNAVYPVEICSTFRRNMSPAIYSSETSVDFQRITRRYIPEDSTLYNHRWEILKSCMSCGAQYVISSWSVASKPTAMGSAEILCKCGVYLQISTLNNILYVGVCDNGIFNILYCCENSSLFKTESVSVWISEHNVIPAAWIVCCWIWSESSDSCCLNFRITAST